MKKLTMIFAALAMGVVLVGCQQPEEGEPTPPSGKVGTAEVGNAAPAPGGEKPADDGHNHKPGEGH